MRKQMIVGMLGLSMLGLGGLAGCDRTVKEEKSVKTDPDTGKQKVDEKKVERTPDGGTKTTEEHKTQNP